MRSVYDQPAGPAAQAGALREVGRFTWPNGNGVEKRLPYNFEYPRVDLFSAWQLWIKGNRDKGYPPFHDVDSSDVYTRKEAQTWSEWGRVMCIMEHEVRAKRPQVELNSDLSTEMLKDLYLVGLGSEWIVRPETTGEGRQRRHTQLHLTTVLKAIRANLREKKESGDDEFR